MTTAPARTVSSAPFRMFSVEVARVRRLSPSSLRLTFSGPDLDLMADNGFDQRVKLILPLAGRGLGDVPTGEDWYAAWRLLPEDRRNPIRTYTVRNVRGHAREVDIDLVVHGPGATALGPACRFALDARAGDQAVLLGPDAAYPGVHGGLEFRPPADDVPLLLAGDETALPAIANIVRALPAHAVGQVLLEVPHPDDSFDLRGPEGVQVRWAARGETAHGARLLRMVEEAEPAEARAAAAPADDSSAEELLWDVPADAQSKPSTQPPRLYAWVAGEASVVRAVRRHLVNVRGHDRRSVAFMGYWRTGRAEC
jgi:NADPH-dependent ferric siderophore reductase